MIDTSGWTVRCAGCGYTRPFDQRAEHNCPNPVPLDKVLDVLLTAADPDEATS